MRFNTTDHCSFEGVDRSGREIKCVSILLTIVLLKGWVVVMGIKVRFNSTDHCSFEWVGSSDRDHMVV